MINIIKNIKLTKNTLIFIMGALFILLFLRQCDKIDSLKTDMQRLQVVSDRNLNNLMATRDSITVEKNKNGNLVSRISSYQIEINNVTVENAKLIKKYKEVLNINKDLKDINTLISSQIKIKDSIINTNASVVYNSNDSIKIEFNDRKNWDKYNWRQFNGKIFFDGSNVISSRFDFSQGMNLKLALLNNDGRNEIKITTSYPGVKFTNIENLNFVNDKLNPALNKNKNWSIGVGIQYGININTDQFVSNGISVGVGIQYSPNWLRF